MVGTTVMRVLVVGRRVMRVISVVVQGLVCILVGLVGVGLEPRLSIEGGLLELGRH